MYSELKSEHNELKSEHSELKSEHSELKSKYSTLMIKHNEAQNVQEHLSLQLAQLMPAEHKLTKYGDGFTFSPLTSHAYGWISPPFYVLGGYKMTIQYKEGTTACLLLLKGEHDDRLTWPMKSNCDLEIRDTLPGSSHLFGVFNFKKLTRVLHGSSQELSNFQVNIKQCTIEVKLRQIIMLIQTRTISPLHAPANASSPQAVAYRKSECFPSKYRRPAPRH